MGSFYANLHLRTTERELVEQAWTSYWDERHETSWAWVTPPYHGWITVFDWNADAGDMDVLNDMSMHLTRALGCVGIAFKVQDSALAEYWLYNLGAEVDYYTSNSEYFAAYAQPPNTTPEEGIFTGYGPDSHAGYATEEDQSDGGNTDLLKSLTRTPVSEMELEAILRTPSYIADDILTALASAIGLHASWAALGYHYIATDSDTVLGKDAFHHLPASEPPNLVRGEVHD